MQKRWWEKEQGEESSSEEEESLTEEEKGQCSKHFCLSAYAILAVYQGFKLSFVFGTLTCSNSKLIAHISCALFFLEFWDEFYEV